MINMDVYTISLFGNWKSENERILRFTVEWFYQLRDSI